MRLIPLSSRFLLISSLASGLALSVGCGEDIPFQDLRETSESSGEDDDDTSDEKDKKDDKTDDKNDTTTTTGGGDDKTRDDKDDTTTTTGGGGDDTDTNSGSDNTDTETKENPMCKKLPGHLVVLGDFTPAGRDPISGPDDAKNGFKMVHEHLKSAYKLNDLEYKNVAEATSEFKAMASSQMQKVDANYEKPVVVLIHSGSNDLAGFIQKSDNEASAAFDPKWGEAKDALDTLVAHFENTDSYPGGVTFFIDTLYNPFDDCQQKVHSSVLNIGMGASVKKTELMGQFNQNLRNYANEHDNFELVDLHPVFLGHGLNHDEKDCSNYIDGADSWMKGGSFTIGQLLTDKSPLTDVNETGHAKVGELINAKFDRIFDGC